MATNQSRSVAMVAMASVPAAGRERTHVRLLKAASLPELLALATIVATALVLGLFRLNQAGYANTYYAAAVRSMLQNWHNFFFVSFDPGGFVSVDKPPLGYWIQTASAKLLGFHGWSILLPQALAGVGSVFIVYLLVRRGFGPAAGLIAAAAMALMPVAVADNRNNTVDSLLVFTLLLAAWSVLHATEHGRLRWLLLGMALVGAGFNIKMLEAYLALPALVALYFAAAPLRWRTRIWHLALGGLVLVAVSLAWVTAVDLTPASQRPYVGSSQHNSELELAFGYNGLQRLVGIGRPGGRGATRTATVVPTSRLDDTTRAAAGESSADARAGSQDPTFGPPNGGGPGFGGPGFVEGGPSMLRLFDQQLGGQASWLLPLALLGLIALATMGWSRSRRSLHRLSGLRAGPQHQQAILWGVWLLTAGGFFSVAGFFHPYYLVTLAPPIAALAGAGLAVMWGKTESRSWQAWILPAALLVTACAQVAMLHAYPEWTGRLTPFVLGFAILGASFAVAARLHRAVPTRAVMSAAALGVAGLLLTPAVWSGITLAQGGGGGMPSGGPGGLPGLRGRPDAAAGLARTALPPGLPYFGPPAGSAGSAPAGGFGPPPGGFGPNAETPSQGKLVAYLQANRGASRFLVAVPSSMSASSIIIQTGEPVMAMGGFSGGDPILTATDVKNDVADGTVRFFLLSGRPGADREPAIADGPEGTDAFGPPPGLPAGGPFGGNREAEQWVTANCSPVAPSQWQDSGRASRSAGFGGGQQLYDCAATS